MKQHFDSPVLVTGGSGFLARHTILLLLNRGHSVRTSVRSAGKGEQLRAMLAAAGGRVDNLETVLADLMDSKPWPDALTGIGHVLHLASPMQGKHVLAAAMDGTKHVLVASAAAGVKRVVLTSSGLAALRPRRALMPDEILTEADWTDSDAPGLDDYARAKTLAEHDAWRLAGEMNLPLTTILPGALLGPALGPEQGAWQGMIADMLNGKMPALPPIRLQMVDVRDVAALHIGALFSPEAAGQRYIAAGESLSLRDIAEMLRRNLGAVAQKVSTREMPAWALRLAALVSPDARRALPLLAASPLLSNDKAQRELDWRPRPMRDSIGDTARSLIGQAR